MMNQQQEIDMFNQLTVENAKELYANYESQLYKEMCQKIHELARDFDVKFPLNTLQFYFYNWFRDSTDGVEHRTLMKGSF